jgi:hypothetical protein
MSEQSARRIVGGNGAAAVRGISRAVAPSTLSNVFQAHMRGMVRFIIWLYGYWCANDKLDLRVKNPRLHHEIHKQRRLTAGAFIVVFVALTAVIYVSGGLFFTFLQFFFISTVFTAVGKQRKQLAAPDAGIQVGISETRIQRVVSEAVFKVDFKNEKFKDWHRNIIVRKGLRESGETMTIRLGLPSPHSATKARAATEQIAAGLDLTVNQVRVIADPMQKNAGDFDIVIYSTNPWDVPPTTSVHVAEPKTCNILEGIDFGYDIDRRRITLEIMSKGVLIGGLPDMGKTTTGLALLSACVLDPYVRLWIADAKGVDTGDLIPIAYRYVGPSQENLLAMLDQLDSWGRKKLAALKGIDIKFTPETIAMHRLIDPNHPLSVIDVVYIDEARFYTNGDSIPINKRITDRLSRIVEMFRAVGIIVIVATQNPFVATIPSDLRNLLRVRLAHACTTPTMSNTILGEGAAGLGYSATQIGDETPGVAWLRVLKSFRQIRPHLTTPQQFAKCCAVAYSAREELGTLPEDIDEANKNSAPQILLDMETIMNAHEWDRISTYVLLEELAKQGRYDGISATSLASQVASWGLGPRGIGPWPNPDSTRVRGYFLKEVQAAITKQVKENA